MHFNNVLQGLLHFILKVENCREGVDENVKHGLFDRVVSILSLRADHETMRQNHIQHQHLSQVGLARDDEEDL